MIRAGRLRDKVTFWQKQQVNGAHGKTDKWVALPTTSRAEVKSQSLDASDDDGSKVQRKKVIRLRYRKDVTDEMRISINHDPQQYHIAMLDNVNGLNRELLIEAVREQ